MENDDLWHLTIRNVIVKPTILWECDILSYTNKFVFWVCLTIGYNLQIALLIGKTTIDQCILGYSTLSSDKPICDVYPLVIKRSNWISSINGRLTGKNTLINGWYHFMFDYQLDPFRWYSILASGFNALKSMYVSLYWDYYYYQLSFIMYVVLWMVLLVSTGESSKKVRICLSL